MKKIVSLLLSVCMATSALFCLGACGKESLPIPQNVHVGNKVLRWEKVENATQYVIKVGDVEYTTENNYYPLNFFEKTGNYLIQVKATGDGYEDSLWKEYSYWFEVEITPTPKPEPEPILPTSKGGLKFNLLEDGSGYEVTRLADKHTGLTGDIVIPSTFNSLPVKRIAERAFEGTSLVTENMGVVGPGPNRVTKSFTIPDSVTEIGERAFGYCVALEKVTLSKSLEKIPQGAFLNCENLKTIEIPEGVKELGMSAFKECTSLESLHLPSTVTLINMLCFESSWSIQYIILSKALTIYHYNDNKPTFYKDTKLLYPGTEAEWAENVTIEYLRDDTSMENTVYFYSETQPTEEGNYWHYGEDGKTPVYW
ncbi:MAG: leucine-rich repeat domain-containing protein [Clostridia bacterium]|nr:leucine-rich repeat domain-containing protein [Clostridia bacterium]